MRANLGYPPGQSYEEMGKTKPVKKGRNIHEPVHIKVVTEISGIGRAERRRQERLIRLANSYNERLGEEHRKRLEKRRR